MFFKKKLKLTSVQTRPLALGLDWDQAEQLLLVWAKWVCQRNEVAIIRGIIFSLSSSNQT